MELKIPQKKTTDLFNLQDFQDDFNTIDNEIKNTNSSLETKVSKDLLFDELSKKKDKDISFVNLYDLGLRTGDILNKTLNSAIQLYNSIIIPKGDYYVNESITLKNDLQLIFEEGCKIYQNSNSNHLFFGERFNNISFYGGEFIGSDELLLGCCISLHQCDNIIAKNMTFTKATYSTHNFDLAGCDGVLISNCIFQGHTPIEGREFTESIQLDFSYFGCIANTSLHNNKATCNVIIEKCKAIPMYNSDGSILKVAPNLVGSHSFGTNRYKNIIVKDNYIKDGWSRGESEPNSGAWLRFYAVDGLQIKGNTIENTTNALNCAISIQTKVGGYDIQGNSIEISNRPLKIDIDGNVIKGFTNSGETARNNGIYIYGINGVNLQQVKITNNTIVDFKKDLIVESQGASGVFLSYVTNAIISQNYITNCKKAIRLYESCYNVNISDNIISSMWSNGIHASGSNGRVTINGNIFENCEGSPVIFSNTGILSITNNIFQGIRYTWNTDETKKRVIRVIKCNSFVIGNNSISSTQSSINSSLSITDSSQNGIYSNNFFDKPIEVTGTNTNIVNGVNNVI